MHFLGMEDLAWLSANEILRYPMVKSLVGHTRLFYKNSYQYLWDCKGGFCNSVPKDELRDQISSDCLMVSNVRPSL